MNNVKDKGATIMPHRIVMCRVDQRLRNDTKTVCIIYFKNTIIKGQD